MDSNFYSEDFYKDKVVKLAEEIQKRRLERRGIVSQEVDPTYVIYARRSTKAPKDQSEDKQDKQERSIKDQLEACKEFAKKNKLKVLAIESEEETAHKSEKRDVFYKILDNIKSGNSYNSILAWHPDRLARNMSDSGKIIDLLDAGIIVDLKFPSFTFVNDPSGKMALGIQFVLAKNYSDGLSVTTGRGIDETVKEGKYTGKSKHGYSPNSDGFFRPNSDFEKVKQIWDAAIEGKTSRQLEKLSKAINYPMDHKAILNMLHEPFYTGIYLHGNIVTDLTAVDSGFKPIISFKDFITIDRNISEKKSFEYSDKIANILFKKMVKCEHCGRYMSPYKSKGQHGDIYYYVGCTSKDCETRQRGFKRAVRGKVIMDYIVEVLEQRLNITKEIYNDAIKNYESTRSTQVFLLKANIESVSSQIKKLQSNIDGLARSLSNASGSAEKEITENINDKSEQLAEKREELSQLEDEFIRLESKISDDVMPYENFSNFFKKAGQAIKSTDDVYLLDQLIRNVFLNFSIKDRKVVQHRLKEPFATYEKMGWDIWGR